MVFRTVECVEKEFRPHARQLWDARLAVARPDTIYTASIGRSQWKHKDFWLDSDFHAVFRQKMGFCQAKCEALARELGVALLTCSGGPTTIRRRRLL